MKRPPLSRAKAELRTAQSALERMRGAHNLDDMEDGWRDYLTALEKAWLKAERECQSFRQQFEMWQQTFRNERKSDPLLCYLLHARNADSHTIQDSTERIGSSVSLGPAHGNAWHIQRLEIRDGKIVDYAGDKPMKITFIPARLQLLPVIDRGVTYPVPATHKDKSIGKSDPITIAALGLAYYEAFIASAERLFLSVLSRKSNEG